MKKAIAFLASLILLNGCVTVANRTLATACASSQQLLANPASNATGSAKSKVASIYSTACTANAILGNDPALMNLLDTATAKMLFAAGGAL